jgi:hypothetical protein
MAKIEWTAEMRAAASVAAKAREAARRAKAAAARTAAPEPVAMPPIRHEGVGAEQMPGGVEVLGSDSQLQTDEPHDDFARFLAAQDAETRKALSDVELRVIYEVEAKRAADEKRAALKKAVAVRAARHTRATAGLIPAETVAAQAVRDRQSQKVSWTVNMPEAGNSGTLIDEGVRINGRCYPHGSQMTGTLGEYESYREIEYRAHENERQFKGQSRMSRLAQTGVRFLNNEVHA